MVNHGGVYIGTVTNTADPDGQGRVQIQLPTMMMAGSQWALVCTAFGAPPNAAPSIGSSVVVAFEGGSLDHPIVLGAV